MTVLDPNEILKQQKNEETTKLQLITPIIQQKWKSTDKIIMEYVYTAGRISIDEYNVAHRGKQKKLDYLLLWMDNVLLAVVEAKGQDHSADDGYSQAVDYAKDLDVPFAFSTNGIDLIEKDMITGINKHMKLENFPGPDELWNRYLTEKGLSNEDENAITFPYYRTVGGKVPRYYQRIAINRAVEHVAKGDKRILLCLATGTGKTFIAFQIIYRFWKMRKMKKILFLADRNILVDQTMRKDFAPFTSAMVKFDNNKIDTSKDIYLALYQQLKSKDNDYYKHFPKDFFDLIVIDEAHRGSASEDSSWREILDWFSDAVQIGLTATPKDGGIEEAIAIEKVAYEKLQTALNSNNTQFINKLKNEYTRAHTNKIKAEQSSKTGNYPFISALNLENNRVKKDDNLLYLNNEQYESLKAGKLVNNDRVMCIRGSLGKHGVFSGVSGAIASSLVIIRKVLPSENADYIDLFLDSPVIFQQINSYNNGTAQPNLSAKNLKQFIVPVPPIEEQQRIVDKLDKLLPLVDKLAELN